MGGDLLSFDEALAELQMGTHELRSLVAQGEIRAYRDEDILKFRRTDVLDLKKTRETGTEGELILDPEDAPAPGEPLLIDEPPTQMIMQPTDAAATVPPPVEQPAPKQPETDLFPGLEIQSVKSDTEETELVSGVGQGLPLDFLGLDDSAPSDGIDTAQTIVPTIEISSDDLIDDTAKTIVPAMEEPSDTDILFGDSGSVSMSAPTLLDDDEQTEMATQEIHSDDAGAPTTVVEDRPLSFADGSTEVAPVPADIGLSTDDVSPTMTGSMTAPRRSARYMAEATAERPFSPVFLALAILTFIIMLFALPLFYGIATDTAPTFGVYKDFMQLFGP